MKELSTNTSSSIVGKAHNRDVIEEEVEALGSVLEHLIDSLRHHLSLGDQLTRIKHGLQNQQHAWRNLEKTPQCRGLSYRGLTHC